MKSENGETENSVNVDPITNENAVSERAVCTEAELKKLAELVKGYWRKLIPKLGLTAENIKSYEEDKSDEAGMHKCEMYIGGGYTRVAQILDFNI